MVRRNGLGILQGSHDPPMYARDRNEHCVLYRTKLVESLGRKLFRNSNIMFVNCAKHEDEQWDYDHNYPGAMKEFGRDKDTQNNEVAIAPIALTAIDFFQCALSVTSSLTNVEPRSSDAANSASGNDSRSTVLCE